MKSPDAEIEAVRAVLRSWDPIGVFDSDADGPAPRDEYDSYAWQIYALLLRRAALPELIETLARIERENLGLRGDPNRQRQIATLLLDLWGVIGHEFAGAFDERHYLQSPDLHDGGLEGIVSRDGGLELLCRSVQGARWILRLPELVHLRADDFRQGNIILDVLTLAGAECPDALLRELFEVTPAAEDPPWFAERRLAVHEGNWTLLRIQCSYGCSLLGLSRRALEISAG